jgi:hypothetical protein
VRNKCNAGESTASSVSVNHQVLYLASEFDGFCKNLKRECQSAPQAKWRPPESDVLKINIDGSMNPATDSAGWGFVIRDRLGEVAGAGAG